MRVREYRDRGAPTRAGRPGSTPRAKGGRLRREHGLDRLHEPTLRDRPDDLLPHRTTLEDDEVRDAADAVADGGTGVVVDVHLDDLQLPRVLARELLDDRRDGSTGGAPR